MGGHDFGEITFKLQRMLNELVEWGKTCGLRFNAEKTAVVHFSRTKLKPNFWISMEGRRLDYSESTKYLGVTVDRELRWRIHIDSKLKAAKKLLALTLAITRSNFGPKPSLMKWTYEGIVRPALSYAALIWSHEMNTIKTQKALQKIDRLALLSIAQVKRSTPTEALRII